MNAKSYQPSLVECYCWLNCASSLGRLKSFFIRAIQLHISVGITRLVFVSKAYYLQKQLLLN